MPHRKRKSSSALSSPFARTSTPRTTSTAISLCLVYTITILFAVVPITPIHCSSAEISVDTTQLKPIASDPHPHPLDTQSARRKGPLNDMQTIDTQGIQDMILEYIDQTLHRRTFEILTGLSIAAKNNSIADAEAPVKQSTRESRRLDDVTTTDTFDVQLVRRFKQFAETRVLNLSLSRALDAGSRSFFFKSLKKFMWPVFISMQVVKTLLLAMFLPSIIGSLGKIVGKGLSSVSGFGGPPVETVENLEFKDNYANANIQAEGDYLYPQSVDALGNPAFAAQMYETAAANNALSRYGTDANKVTYVNSASDYRPAYSVQRPAAMAAAANSATAYSKQTNFKDFHDIPASSMLLTNYDPFYSPLLSRLDAVFQQMGLPAGNNEKCREKLVCQMYASPAKYAPYSNLVSAQLSRELNELKKPTTDNPDILRFFKYMRAAKDGQDRTNCDAAFPECTRLTDSDSPAMLTTYNDINKLVQARKF